MSRDNRLAPDQRAVLELVLRQDRSYGELSELLGIPERDVRARAEAGLRTLAGDPGADVDSALITDFLLDQQTPEESERTSLHLAETPKAQAWMAAASMSIADLGAPDPNHNHPNPPPSMPQLGPGKPNRGRRSAPMTGTTSKPRPRCRRPTARRRARRAPRSSAARSCSAWSW